MESSIIYLKFVRKSACILFASARTKYRSRILSPREPGSQIWPGDDSARIGLLLRYRQAMVRRSKDIANTLRGTLKAFGIGAGDG
jgi:hypothetical protein